MANITISELRPVGSELFQDSESYLNELGEQEMGLAQGGGKYNFQLNYQYSQNNNNQQFTVNNAQTFANIKEKYRKGKKK